MPCFMGIDIALATPANPEGLSEFPHPDASAVPWVKALNRTASHDSSASTLPLVSDPTCFWKPNPRISVYVPSISGSQFWIQFSAEQLPESPKYLFFKTLINGRTILSLGVSPMTQGTGCIKRALYEPGDRWHWKSDGMVLKHEGIEARYFHFLSASKESAVAEDGGLIEVQVLRAYGRKRRAPLLIPYRSQEAYGIASPSGGLLDCPEDAAYYDWLLVDPKHSPYATFRFHYRSWRNLHQLSLVPSSEETDCKLAHTKSKLDLQDIEPQKRRPLPEIPKAAPLPVQPPCENLSKPNKTSNGTPYMPFIEEEELSDSDNVEVGTAKEIPLRSDSCLGGQHLNPSG